MRSASWFRRAFLPIVILIVAFGLRLYHLDFQSIWWDEGHSIFVASHPMAEIPTLPAMDVHPPAYFALLRLWSAWAGSSEFALRYLSVIFSLMTVALMWRFGAKIIGLLKDTATSKNYTSPLPVLAALMAALSPMYVAYAQEVRSYAMITFLAVVSTLALWKIVFAGSQSTPHRHRATIALYILSTAACLYTHYFTIFLLLFQNLVWLIWAILPRPPIPSAPPHKIYRRSKIKIWIPTQAAILLLFLPQLRLALRQVTSYTNPNLIPPTLPYFISRSWQAYTAGLTINPTPAQWAGWSFAGVLLITWTLVFIVLSKSRRPPDKPKTATPESTLHPFLFLLAWFTIPLAIYFVILQRRPSFEPRYLMLVTPALFLLPAFGLAQLRYLKKYAERIAYYVLRISYYVLLAVTLCTLIVGLYHYYTNETFFKDDSAGVARWLATETTANDIVYVDVPHPFHYYAKRENIPAPTAYLFVDAHTAADTLNREAAGRDRLFWVTWWGSDTDPRGIIRFLVEKAGQPAGQRDFKGYRVEWFNLAPDVEFSLPSQLPPANAIFGNVVRLDGIALGNTAIPGNPAWATLHFTLLQNTDTDYKVSLRLRGNDGQIAGQIDRDILNDRHFRTSAWPLNDPALNQAINVYLIPLPSETPPGVYQLEAVLYNAKPPYPSEGVAGHQTSDGVAAILGQVTVSP